MSVLGSIDGWIMGEALRHEGARRRGDMLRSSLPGVGFLKFFGAFIVAPLIASEAMFLSGLPALPVPVVVLILLAVLSAFCWRYFRHRRRIRAGDVPAIASDKTPVPSIGNRPPWWNVAVTSLAGVVTGGFVFLVLQWPLTFLLDHLFGRSGWQESLGAWPQLFGFSLLIVYWTIALALGQFLSAMLSGWARTVYAAAALQTFHLVIIFQEFDLVYLWVLPGVTALGLTKVRWAAAAAERVALGRQSWLLPATNAERRFPPL